MHNQAAARANAGDGSAFTPRKVANASQVGRFGSPLLVGQWIACGCLALVVFDSPLGPVGRTIGLGLAVAGGLAAIRLVIAHPAWRWVATVSAGAIGVVVGFGYGAQRLAEGSLGQGLVTMGAGIISLGVLGTGAYLAIRATPGWWRLLSLPVGAVIFQFALLPATYGTSGVHGMRTPLTEAPPPGASSVSFVADDGVELRAWYMSGRNGAALVLLPGAGGNRGHTIDHARELLELGYGVLAMDARGTGDSGGHNNLWGWDGTRDIAAAVEWLSARPEVTESIGLVGLSMGAEQALTAAPDLSAVSAVVSEGVQARMSADTWYVQDGVRGWVERTVSTIMWGVADLWTDAPPPASLREVASRFGDKQVLIIAADSPDERAVAADLAQRSPAVEVWQTSGVGHTQALQVQRVEWQQRVGTFLNQALLGR